MIQLCTRQSSYPWDASRAGEMRQQTLHLGSREQKRWLGHHGTSAKSRLTPHCNAAKDEWVLSLALPGLVLCPAIAAAFVLGAARPALARSVLAGWFRDGLCGMRKDAAITTSRARDSVFRTFGVVCRRWTVSIAPFSGGGNGSGFGALASARRGKGYLRPPFFAF